MRDVVNKTACSGAVNCRTRTQDMLQDCTSVVQSRLWYQEAIAVNSGAGLVYVCIHVYTQLRIYV